MAAVGVEPNAENKLFVGGCPPGSNEQQLRELFGKHGVVEEVFVMKGGSRSGMACAFVRFTTQEMAQEAITAIHGQQKLPDASEPLVVRWADAPGSRKRDAREGGRRRGGGGGGRGGGYPMGGGMIYGGMGYGNFQMQQMMMIQQQQQMPGMSAANYAGGPGFYPPQQAGMQPGPSYGAGMPPSPMGYPPQMLSYVGQHAMVPQWAMPAALGSSGPSSPQHVMSMVPPQLLDGQQVNYAMNGRPMAGAGAGISSSM
mmetsp:Transcript_53669/g.138736  ORF Transcript_53669/g.138736 Transcript_53669/m.138736 type:complete len:256 (-) Transcript_53669:386-1153(-)